MLETLTYASDRIGETDHLHVPLFAMDGYASGPRLVATAPDHLARRLAEKLWDLPSLGRMRGALVVRSDTQDPIFDRPDFVLELPEMSERDAYYSILSHMADLGMIMGRGIPRRRVA